MRRTYLMAVAAVVLATAALSAQGGAPAGAAAGQGGAPAGRAGGPATPPVVSPQVDAAAGMVTLRLMAPRATEVNVTGEILNGAPPKAMTKGADGVWTATLGPLPADVYTYAFNIDGVNTTDPRNPWVKLVSGAGLASQVDVPAKAGLSYYDAKPVPHGLVSIMTYESKSIGATRQAYVYTPPGYHTGNTRYPVLYLLHGGGDLDPGWVMTGRANFIMDNLIAEKKALPMVVVMPVARGGGSLGVGPAGMSPGNAGPGTPAAGGRGAAPAAGTAPPPVQPAAMGAFAQDFVADLMPAVERTFRVSNRPEHRAMAGLSAGGAATVNTVFSRPDLFRWTVILSAGAQETVVQQYPKFFENNAAAAKAMKLVWLAAGDEDFALNGTKTLDGVLTKQGIKHELHITKGRHEWRIWREHLNMFAPLLFR